MKAAIFDCDGTLVDSEGLGNEVLVGLAARHGLEMSLPQAIKEFRGGKMADCIALMETRLGRPFPGDFIAEVRAEMARVFRERLQPVAGARQLVEGLRCPYCVASSGPVEKIRLSLGLTDLLHLFEERIFSSYEIGSWKPDPGIFLYAARAMGVSPTDCAVVEDSRFGVEAGLAAGMRVFAYLPHGADFEVPREVVVVEHLSELEPWFSSART